MMDNARGDRLVIRGGTLVTETALIRGDLLVLGERIVGIEQDAERRAADRVIDATGLLILPGGVDAHVHARDPDEPLIEGFHTATMAAAAGGITTIIEMPQAEPLAADGETFRVRRAAAERNAVIDVALYGAVVGGKTTPDDLAAMRAAGAIAFKAFMVGGSAGMVPVSDTDLLHTLEALRESGMIFTVHAENANLVADGIRRMREAGQVDPLAHARSRPAPFEAEAVQRAIFLAEVTGGRLHIAHVTCQLALEFIQAAKSRGVHVTAETCPQYLVMDVSDLARKGGFARCAPPLRTRGDVEALWRGLADGALDFVCSDHCGYTIASKEAGWTNIFDAPQGLSVIQHMLPVVYDNAINVRGWSWPDIVRRTATTPARLFGLAPRKGALAIGADADIVLYDPNTEATVTREGLLTRQKWSAFEGRTYRGRVVRTLVRGREVFVDGQIVADAGNGRFLTPAYARDTAVPT
ncbi:MAG: allantoinase AllB [Thermomicrobia bacterium]|nr:allantoinase AllB [Thermomicrobia bacterium]